MTGTHEVAVLVGSLRRDSYSRRLALDVMQRSPGQLDCRLVEIGALALYNEDLEAAPSGCTTSAIGAGTKSVGAAASSAS